MNDYLVDIIELNSYDECCICLNTLDKKDEDDVLLKLGCCKKMLHKGCLISWMCYGNYTELKCPMCRSVILNITSLVLLKDICDMNKQLNNNTLMMIDEYYKNDEMYGEYVRRRDINGTGDYYRIDKTIIYSAVVCLIILMLTLACLCIYSVKRQ
jgi:hypothetical protein